MKKIRVARGDHATVFNKAMDIFDDGLKHKEFQQLAALGVAYLNSRIGNGDGEENYDTEATLRSISSLDTQHSYVHSLKKVKDNEYEIMWRH